MEGVEWLQTQGIFYWNGWQHWVCGKSSSRALGSLYAGNVFQKFLVTRVFVMS